MGHKTHPLGFRLGILNPDQSFWYSSPNSYTLNLKEDYEIRKLIFKLILTNNSTSSGVTNIIIKRSERKKKIYIEIKSVAPEQIVGESGSRLRKLDKKISSLVEPKTILINIIKITKPYTEATLLVDVLIFNLQKRISFRKCIRKILERYRIENELNGIKIQIAGRLNGAEIARTEWVREGRVPLQTLRADIDYCYKTAQTSYGILGIKIWIFKTEILTKNLS
uniref:Small ribosomal subunit protein uS3c n=1 Tax=Dictyopteris divaricata TaxID=156996 RepID=A0A2I4Q2H9_9PHAE|nr:30S ribosomal protein S3 [Dictyopteris divaricata]AQZ25048.1 30S ribosomal protein S3 [Dictyopteris divaricata]